ncbi:MAG: peptide MFS transporter, partial [Steroidobacteraceae bacterium]
MTTDVQVPAATWLGHPKGLFLLFVTEMWERFSYYGMRALLVLYAVAATDAVNPGLGWDNAQALTLYAWYTGLVYFTPLFGGWLADNFIGQRKA